jgi:DNA-binding response OmpR family regulator
MAKILIIDDQPDLVQLLKDSLESCGHETLIAYNGVQGVTLASEEPDLVILDIMMPEMDGYEVCRAIRDVVVCPILFLSAKQSETDRIRGLALGGDDYILKPFSLPELLARVDAHLRREARVSAHRLKEDDKRIRHDNLAINLKARGVEVKHTPISLTRREFEIVEFLALHPRQVFSRDQIYEKLWGYDAEGDAATVTEHIKNIRAKISELDPDTQYIGTVWGIGYRWEKLG